jgi:hypothetical protein
VAVHGYSPIFPPAGTTGAAQRGLAGSSDHEHHHTRDLG